MTEPSSSTPGEGPPRARRLAHSRSAYLREAADQPIDWHEWGREAFELAERLDRPVLLDIGAVWCHWCHVMDQGTYSDPEVARLLRQHFIAVKVDRDDLPEVDRRYQRAVSVLTGQGGWPLTAFLTPAGEAFLGGTYFPPEDGLGRPGFRRVLKEVARIWKDDRGKASGNVQAVSDALARHGAGHAHATPRPFPAFVASVLEQVHQSYDPVNGGFSFAPKFPHPTAVELLLHDGYARGAELSDERALETLRRMADGGLYDQLGDGFHRYATDEAWHIPHFEKMASDNAALLAAFAAGARRFDDARLAETVVGVTRWADSVLGDAGGGWGASQDADNAPGDDGGYFTWSRSELKAALDPEELRIVQRFFGVGSEGRMPDDPDRNVLFRLLPIAEAAGAMPIAEAERRLAQAVRKLRAVREHRPTPYVDRALYADLNGGFLRGFAAASAVVDDPFLLTTARRAADRFLKEAYAPDRGLAHRLGPEGPSGWGHLEDQAMFALGLVELAGATAEPKYVAAADRLLELLRTEYPSSDGLLLDLAPRIYDGPRLGRLDEPSTPVEDNPHLSPNAAAAIALVRRAALGEDEHYRQQAKELLAHLVPRVEGAGLFGAGTALAVGLLETPPARVVVEGEGPDADRLRRAALAAPHPNRFVFRGTPPAPFSLPSELAAPRGVAGARALVCFGDRCLAPVTDPARLRAVLASGGRDAA